MLGSKRVARPARTSRAGAGKERRATPHRDDSGGGSRREKRTNARGNVI